MTQRITRTDSPEYVAQLAAVQRLLTEAAAEMDKLYPAHQPGDAFEQATTRVENARDLVGTMMQRATQPEPINCDYGPAGEIATRITDSDEALCDAHAREHYGSDWQTETHKLGARALARLTAARTV